MKRTALCCALLAIVALLAMGWNHVSRLVNNSRSEYAIASLLNDISCYLDLHKKIPGSPSDLMTSTAELNALGIQMTFVDDTVSLTPENVERYMFIRLTNMNSAFYRRVASDLILINEKARGVLRDELRKGDKRKSRESGHAQIGASPVGNK